MRFNRVGYRGRNKKRDANEAGIIAALELAGALVVPLDKPVDLLVGFRGRTMLLEVKNPEGADRLEPDQVRFLEAWTGAPVVIVRTPEEAVAALRDSSESALLSP